MWYENRSWNGCVWASHFRLFNTINGEEGLKISGAYSYDIYEEILFEMIGEKPTPSERPPIEWFIAYFQFASAKEIAVVYDLTLEEVEREMKSSHSLKR